MGAIADRDIPMMMSTNIPRMCLRRPIRSAYGEMKMPPAAMPMVPALSSHPVSTLLRPHTSGLARNGAT